MTYLRKSENIKVCPECGTNLMHTARHCAACDYEFIDVDPEPVQEDLNMPEWRILTPITIRVPILKIHLPVFLGLIFLLLAVNTLVVLGLQKREQTENLVAAEQATATFVATTYISPTPEPTATFTPGPPTQTPIVDIEYTVAPGDSCLSIADRFDIYLDRLLMKNDIDCALLQIGTVLIIPPPVPTPEATSTTEGMPAP